MDEIMWTYFENIFSQEFEYFALMSRINAYVLSMFISTLKYQALGCVNVSIVYIEADGRLMLRSASSNFSMRI